MPDQPDVQRIFQHLTRAVADWHRGLSSVAAKSISTHDISTLHGDMALAIYKGCLPKPKAGDRVRWTETGDECVLTRVEDGKAWGLWGGEGVPESHLPVIEVVVVPQEPTS